MLLQRSLSVYPAAVLLGECWQRKSAEFRPEPRGGVDGRATTWMHLEMEVVPRARSGTPHGADDLPGRDSISDRQRHGSGGEVCVDARDDLTVDDVLDAHMDTEGRPSRRVGLGHDAGGHRPDGRASRCAEVDALVEARATPAAPGAIRTGNPRARRHRPLEGGRR